MLGPERVALLCRLSTGNQIGPVKLVFRLENGSNRTNSPPTFPEQSWQHSIAGNKEIFACSKARTYPR